jgi:hypothetical protein
MFRSVRNFLNKRKTAQCVIASSDNGVKFLSRGVEVAGFFWDRVQRIVTYKDDLMTTDLICLEFEVGDGLVYLAHEEAPGFEHLCIEMVRAIPTIDPNWIVTVMQPAFARNLRVLHG